MTLGGKRVARQIIVSFGNSLPWLGAHFYAFTALFANPAAKTTIPGKMYFHWVSQCPDGQLPSRLVLAKSNSTN